MRPPPFRQCPTRRHWSRWVGRTPRQKLSTGRPVSRETRRRTGSPPVDTAVDGRLSIGVVSRETASARFINSLYAQLVDTAVRRSRRATFGSPRRDGKWLVVVSGYVRASGCGCLREGLFHVKPGSRLEVPDRRGRGRETESGRLLVMTVGTRRRCEIGGTAAEGVPSVAVMALRGVARRCLG